MEAFLLILVGIIVWLVCSLIEFIIPLVLIYLLITQPYNITFWVWAILLILWFVARLVVYVVKETKKND